MAVAHARTRRLAAVSSAPPSHSLFPCGDKMSSCRNRLPCGDKISSCRNPFPCGDKISSCRRHVQVENLHPQEARAGPLFSYFFLPLFPLPCGDKISSCRRHVQVENLLPQDSIVSESSPLWRQDFIVYFGWAVNDSYSVQNVDARYAPAVAHLVERTKANVQCPDPDRGAGRPPERARLARAAASPLPMPRSPRSPSAVNLTP